MDNDKKTNAAGGVAGTALIMQGAHSLQSGDMIGGIVTMIAGLALLALGFWTNK